MRWQRDGTYRTRKALIGANTAYDRIEKIICDGVLLVDRSSGGGAWRAYATGGLIVSQHPALTRTHTQMHGINVSTPFRLLHVFEWTQVECINNEMRG